MPDEQAASQPPSIDQIRDADLKAQAQAGLGLEPGVRPNLTGFKKKAEELNDRVAIAYAAYSLGYSFDHYEPYDFARAIKELNVALNYYPNWLEARFNRAAARVHAKEFREAIEDFDAAEQMLYRAINFEDDRWLLMMGKLLLFRAEARLGLETSGERFLAAQEITRAETILIQCKGDLNSQFWLRQIPTRFKSTIVIGATATEPRGQVSIRHPLSFAAGVLSGLGLLAALYFATDKAVPLPPPPPSSKDAKSDEAKKPAPSSGGSEKAADVGSSPKLQPAPPSPSANATKDA